MKKIALSDVRGPRLYEGFRDDLRKRVIELKRRRRFALGPLVTLVFENRATVLFQIEEMCRAEGIVEPGKIAHEVDTYNALLPDEGELAATLFIELTDEATMAETLQRLVGLQEHVGLAVDGRRLPARFDPEQFETDRLAAVQYLRFPLDAEAQAALKRPGTALAVYADHPRYAHETALDDAARGELALDLG